MNPQFQLLPFLATALLAPVLQAGTTNTTFSFQQGDLLQDGLSYGSGTGYAGVVDGTLLDNSASSARSTGATNTLGNAFQSGSPNGRQYCGVFSYDLTELNDFITANTSATSSVAIQSVSFQLVSAGGNAGGSMGLNLYGTDPFTSSDCTWANYTTATPWTVPYQSLGPPNDAVAYGFTGGPSALTAQLGGTTPNVTTTSGNPLTWGSSANFISALTNALGRTDKTLYLAARPSFFNNGDNRLAVNYSPAATVANRPKLLVTLTVNTYSDWTGASSTSWATAGNWTSLPGTGDNARFNSLSTANLATVLNQDFSLNGVSLIDPSGAVSIGGANSLTLGAGGLDLSAATQNLTITAPIIAGAAQSWNVASITTLGISGAVSGSGDITVAGAGKVSLGASSILPNGASAGNLAVSGTLDLNGTSQSINGLSGAGVVDNSAGGASILTVGNNNAAGTFSGILKDTGSGTLAVVKTGTGQLTLTGANDFSGGFTNNSVCNVAPNNSLAFGTGAVVFNAGTIYATETGTFANTLALNGSTLRIGGGGSKTITWNGPVTATGTSGLICDGGTSGITLGSTLNIAGATFSSSAGGTTNSIVGNISGAGGNLNVTAGTLQLSGANSYTGTTTLSGSGVLRLQPTGTISSSSNVVVNGSGNFLVRNTVGWVYTGTITGDGTGSVNLNTATNATLAGNISGVTGVNANSTSTNATVSGTISGAVGASVQGGAILTLSGNNSAMSGTVTLNGGTAATQLNIKSATALGTGTLFIGGGNNGKIDNTSGAALTLGTNNVQTWNSDLTFVGTDDLNLGTGAVTLGGNRTIFAQNNTLTVGGVIGEASAGLGLTKGSTGGTLVLTGNSTYSGATVISGGTLSISSIANYNASSAIGAPASGHIQLGAANNFCGLTYTGSSASTNRTVQLGDATAANTGVGSLKNNGSGSLTFTAIPNFNPTISGITATRTLWLGGTYTGGPNEIQGVIQDNAVAGKVNVGKGDDASTWVLSGANTYTGSTIVQGGMLKLGATGSIASSSAVSINAGATLDTSAQATYTIPGAQPLAFGIDAGGGGSSGKIAADGLNISSAVVTYNIAGTPNDPVYVLATYTVGQLTGTFASVPTPPLGYTLNYAYLGNKIALVQAAGTPYQTWAGSAFFNDDANGDGVKNGLAWILGATDKDVSALNKLPTVATPTGYLTLAFKRVNPYAPAKLYIEYSNNLASWTKLEIPAATGTIPLSDVEVVVTPGTPDDVTVKIPTATHSSGGKLFGRLSSTEN